MINMNLIYRSIGYTLQVIIIYFLLRYLPITKLSTVNSILIAMVLLLLTILVEIVIKKFVLKNKTINNIFKTDCTACNTPSIPKGCRLVCDKIENFDDKKNDDTKKEDDKKREYSPDKMVNDTQHKWSSKYGNRGYDNKYAFGGMYYDDPEGRSYDTGTVEDPESLIKLRKQDEDMREFKKRENDRAFSITGYKTAYQQGGPKGEMKKAYCGKGDQNRRIIEGTLDDEFPYTDYNHLPMAAGYKSHAYEFGYSYIPPEKWFPMPVRSPICISEKRAPIMPSWTSGAPLDVKEWNSSRRITPPDLINIQYTKDKLNSGR